MKDYANWWNVANQRDDVEVKLRELAPPKLAFIFPNPSENADIFLDWNDIFRFLECIFTNPILIFGQLEVYYQLA